ncbi:hypothetical protein IEN92_04910 [Polynucleobacter sp. MWH-Creno-3A4]|uniref:hypothetical protein n=1 Tax=Polynucleobacter sp. MWH-Creno-3A4 TaxID=1855886 RepID=UPI001C0ADB84|nr:hypothetical protein [Polynucleobacter sp. MWH-Creno-3A4]MBU3606088.1 hypothetical protein [Polynucleobacter sp. MWH-Creno-3A4]
MILAWVISLLLLCESLVLHLERLSALQIITVQTIEQSQQNFIAVEKAVADCESNLTSLNALNENACFIQSIGKNIWRITSQQKPGIEIHIALDVNAGMTTRLNWRQVFE